MQINWKLRLKNKTILFSLIAAFIALVYQILAIFDITPRYSESQLVNIVGLIINILVGLGVIVDPTTQGISDSERAMTYERPN